MPERTTIEYSDDNEPVNMTFRNSTDQRMIDEGRIVIKTKNKSKYVLEILTSLGNSAAD